MAIEGQSQHSGTSSARRRQKTDLAAAKERRRAAAATVAAAARASRLAQAELVAARAEVEAAVDAARAATAEVEDLRSSHSSSITADDSADLDLELLERDVACRRAAQWAAAHAHERGRSLDRHGGAGSAREGGAHGNSGGQVEEEHGLSQAAWLSPRTGTVATTGTRLLSGMLALVVGGLPSPRPTMLSGLR